MKSHKTLLPDKITFGGYTYKLSSSKSFKDGDWYIDHQKYNWGIGDPVEEVNQKGLADYLNEDRDGWWHSKKIIATDNPKLIVTGVPTI